MAHKDKLTNPPKRAGNPRELPIPLEATLSYALMLATMPASEIATPKKRARHLGVEVRAQQRREAHPDFELVRKLVDKLQTARSRKRLLGTMSSST